MYSLLTDPNAVAIASGLIGLGLIFIGNDKVRWDIRIPIRWSEYQQLKELEGQHYKHRPGKDSYALVSRLALPYLYRFRRRRLLERALLAQEAGDHADNEGCYFARAWLQSVGQFSVQAAVHHELPLRPFLQTHHLGVIREGLTVLPFVMNLYAHGELTSEEKRQAEWGLAFVELAAYYNALAPWQRDPVFIRVEGVGHFGPILLPPGTWRVPILNWLNAVQRDMKLPAWRRVGARGRLRRVSRQLLSRTAGAP